MASILVIGDTVTDKWVTGHSFASADECPSLEAKERLLTPGGAANVSRQLQNTGYDPWLLCPLDAELAAAVRATRVGKGVSLELGFPCPRMPRKTRYLDAAGRIVFRADSEPLFYGLPNGELQQYRDLAIKTIRQMPWAAVILSDYQKGFVTDSLARRAIEACQERDIPCFVDPKRPPTSFRGGLFKINQNYFEKHQAELEAMQFTGVVTRGSAPPVLFRQGREERHGQREAAVSFRNHVGAGDCFLAHLAAARVDGQDGHDWQASVTLADAAARVYVQHAYGRVPSSLEIQRQLRQVAGKICGQEDARELAQVVAGKKIVLANGVFRLPHAGHAWLCDWAKQQGDVLIVAINDDASAARQRPGQKVLPLKERAFALASLAAVDWVIAFGEDTPAPLLEILRPHLLVKGAEYVGSRVPGDELAEVCFAPDSPFREHATSLIAALAEA